jgi:hypothetical protein
MGSWIRKNLVLVAGIVLPVVLVASFFVLQRPPGGLGDPPEYDFLVVAYRYDAQHPKNYTLSFEVREGRLRGKATPIDERKRYSNRQGAVLFRYDSVANAFSEIAWDLPSELDDIEKVFRFPVAEVSHLDLSRNERSPDGYRFEYGGYRGRGGLLGELFGMGRNGRQFVLEREGGYFRLPSLQAQPYYYGNDVRFLGWVIEGEDGS